MGNPVKLWLKPFNTVSEVKAMINKVTGVSTDQLRLSVAGKQLSEDRTLSCNKVKSGDTFSLHRSEAVDEA